jgi:hypothetical protein
MPAVSKNLERAGKIAHAGSKLCARQGNYSTSTRAIYCLAEVSEDAVFRYFDRKEEQFGSSFGCCLAGPKLRPEVPGELTQCEPPEVVLPKVIEMLTDTFGRRPGLLRLIVVAGIELRAKADEFCPRQLSPVFSAINRCSEIDIERESIRPLDSTVLITWPIIGVWTHTGNYNPSGGKEPVYSSRLGARRAHGRFWRDLAVPRMSTYLPPVTEVIEERSG